MIESEKKTERKWLRLTPSQLAEVETLARLHDRPVAWMLAALVREGLSSLKRAESIQAETSLRVTQAEYGVQAL